MGIKAPYLPYEKLRQVAADFLAQHHAAGTLPIPIERIIEFGFGMDIVPVPGLHDGFEIDSYLTSDLCEIHVDEFVYKNRPGRYRFSLAHELSHRLIHSDIFGSLRVTCIDEWKAAVRSIPERQYEFIEQQAYNLAGLILVPSAPLAERFAAIQRQLEEAGLSLDDATPDLWDRLVAWLAKDFAVSRDVISRRGPKDGLWDK